MTMQKHWDVDEENDNSAERGNDDDYNDKNAEGR